MQTEFEFIDNLKKKYSLTKIGDDCAVLPKDSRNDLVITTDLIVEDIDFRLDWITPELLGNKTLSVSLSDVAAMGANPVWAMVSIGIPENIWNTDFLDRFYRAWLSLSAKFEVELVGGDISRTSDKIFIDSIVAGEVKKGKAIRRSNARPNDLIFVTGELGGAAAGLKLLEKGIRVDSAKRWQKKLIDRQLKPFPQVHCGKEFGVNQIPSAMIDLSDGLSSDLAHICRQSKVGAKIFADKIPFHKHLKSLTSSFDERLDLAINGGEDFELLFTVNPKKYSQLKKRSQNFPFQPIGEITSNAEIIELIIDSKTRVLDPKGFRHF